MSTTLFFYSISQNQFHISVYRAESRFGSGLAENQEEPKTRKKTKNCDIMKISSENTIRIQEETNNMAIINTPLAAGKITFKNRLIYPPITIRESFGGRGSDG